MNTLIPDYPKRMAVQGREDIYLRLSSLQDIDELYTVVETNREHLQVYQGWAKTMSYSDAKQAVASRISGIEAGNSIQFRIAETESDKLIGTITIFDFDLNRRSIKIGVWLTKEAEGKGYAYDSMQTVIECAFQQWNIAEIILRIADENIRSKRLAEKLGAQQTDEWVTDESNEEIQLRIWAIKNNEQ